MFCASCGTELPDRADYCLKCGKPQKQGVSAGETHRDGNLQQEVCEIFYINGVYAAEAIGPKGKYYTGMSKKFWVPGWGPDIERVDHRNLLDELVNQLISKGWQPEGTGRNWYNKKFRRNVDASTETCQIYLISVKLGLVKSDMKWVARVIDSIGSEAVAESPVFKGPTLRTEKRDTEKKYPEMVQAHDSLARALVSSGWVYVAQGPRWWANQFSRKRYR